MKIQPPALPMTLDQLKVLGWDRSPTPSIIIDRQGKLLDVNHAFVHWSRFTSGGFLRSNIAKHSFFPADLVSILLNFSANNSVKNKIETQYFTFFPKRSDKVRAQVQIVELKDEKRKAIGRIIQFTTETTLLSNAEIEVRQKVLAAVSSAAEYFLKSNGWEDNIHKVLSQMGNALNLDWLVIFFNDMRQQKFEWSRDSSSSLIHNQQLQKLLLGQGSFKKLHSQLINKKVLRFDQVHQDVAFDHDLSASIFIPLFVEQKWWGYVLAVEKSGQRVWQTVELEALQMLTNIISAAILNNNVKIELRQTVEYLNLEQEKVLQEIENTQKFQQAVDAATDGIVISTPQAEVIYVNPAWQKLTGYSSSEVLGKNLRILQSDKTPKKVFQDMWRSLSLGEPFTTEEIINRRRDGSEYPVHLSVFPIRHADATQFYVGIHQDITERKELEQRKTEFISIASHQLNTPLSAMKWFLELLMLGKAGELSDKQREFVQNIYDSNDRMIALVRSLLNISRIESGRIIIDPKPTSIRELVNHILEEVRPHAASKQQKLEVSIESHLPKIKIDPKLVSHVYLNLLSNAVKYTPERGQIRLTITRNKDSIVSKIKDTGFGIPQGDHDKIFEKFFRADNVVKLQADGSGLGLYLVKTVIDSSGGKIEFSSQEGKGSEFTIYLPIKGSQSKEGEVSLDPHHQW